MGSNTIHPGSQGLDRGLSVVPEPCIGPQQLLDGHPGVPCPHRGCIYHWLHHQAGQQCQETCKGTKNIYLYLENVYRLEIYQSLKSTNDLEFVYPNKE